MPKMKPKNFEQLYKNPADIFSPTGKTHSDANSNYIGNVYNAKNPTIPKGIMKRYQLPVGRINKNDKYPIEVPKF